MRLSSQKEIVARSRSSLDTIRRAVRECDIYLGVYGARHGWIIDDLDVSVTELEFDEAQALGKPTLVYVKAADHEPRQKIFLQRVQEFYSGFFRPPPFTDIKRLAKDVVRPVVLVAELV